MYSTTKDHWLSDSAVVERTESSCGVIVIGVTKHPREIGSEAGNQELGQTDILQYGWVKGELEVSFEKGGGPMSEWESPATKMKDSEWDHPNPFYKTETISVGKYLAIIMIWRRSLMINTT